ncbi:MAG: aminotransferase class V-fold PLP-dependent enzyme [Deltaproteobacteria bacterium]|nr:aminotransferase class V-fold PLP-dependent enzyme [Deltaproteobacteria bacterium]
MSFTLSALRTSPNALASHYEKFRVKERLLFTGHSHQAWPDCGFQAQAQAWLDAAEHVDDKWTFAFAQADRVRDGYARLLNDTDGDITLGVNTHELLVRWLSALPLQRRPRLVTTDGEFHTIRRQLARLQEEGLEVVVIPSAPGDSVAERLSAALDDRTAAVLVSAVFYRDARIVDGLDALLSVCQRVGAELLVDAYHALGAIPFSLSAQKLGAAFVVGGGYKYCQLGEGNAFLRSPPGCRLRPLVTGWFAEFGLLGASAAIVGYGEGGLRFAGATYDPTSHYRGAAVFDFFEAHGLTPEFLRTVSQHQVNRLRDRFDSLDADPATIARDTCTPRAQFAGFLALETPHAAALTDALRRRGVMSDQRQNSLRLGPAPYLSDDQLDRAIDALGDALASL